MGVPPLVGVFGFCLCLLLFLFALTFVFVCTYSISVISLAWLRIRPVASSVSSRNSFMELFISIFSLFFWGG